MKTNRFLCMSVSLLVGVRTLLASGIIVLPESGASLAVLKDGEPYISLQPMGWGANWSWIDLSKNSVESADGVGILKAVGAIRSTKVPVEFQIRTRKTGPAAVSCDVSVSVAADSSDVNMVLAIVPDAAAMAGGGVTLTYVGGQTNSQPYPWARRVGDKEARAVEKLVVTDAAGAQTVYTFTPAVMVGSEGALRIALGGSTLLAGQPRSLKIDMELPEPVTFYPDRAAIPQEPGFESWYEFKAGTNHLKPSVISMADWLDAPAGKKGRIAMQGEKLVLAGQEIKLWGLNLCYGHCCPDKALSDQRAALYAKYGVNTVRLHKFADGPDWMGVCLSNSFAEFNAQALDKMDYLVAQLKARGIYVELSPNFGVKIGTKDREAIPYWTEFRDGQIAGWKSTGGGSQYYGQEIGDLQIRQMVNFLQHRNPYTGLTYAEDPAIYCVEMANEDDAFWFSQMRTLKQSATLRARAGARFAAWLKNKYGTPEALKAAWGGKALNSFASDGFAGESWTGPVYPAGNPWYYDPDQLDGSMCFQRQRLLDTMEFLYGLQNEYYTRYQKAVRAAGFGGLMLASNWQAGGGASHYYNLHTDYTFGLIDRHNYFGGGSQTAISKQSMLSFPGSGMLSSGMQQVSDRPFMLSEWVHVRPNEWGVEGPAIMGAYAMGLQGWDISYMFQNRDEGRMGSNLLRDEWQVVKPTHMGLFPAVSRQVLRGDVKESGLVIPRYVHIPSLRENKLGTQDKVQQTGDTKSFDSREVPGKALAIGRCVIEFTDQYRDTPVFNTEPYITNGCVSSSTGQLEWHGGKTKVDGYITLNTDGTKAVVGFAAGKRCDLGGTTVKMDSRFGAVYLTAIERDATIQSSKHLLITAIARVRHSGMKIFADTFIVAEGRPPLVMEPVKAELTLKKEGNPTVYLLDHDGVRTEKTLPLNNGVIQIDTGRDQTPYYEIVY